MNGWQFAFFAVLIPGVLLAATIGFLIGRAIKAKEDAPLIRRGRADAALVHQYLPHNGPYDTEMRGVTRV